MLHLFYSLILTQDSASGRAVRSLYEGVNKHIHDTLSSAKVHIQREELWKKLLYGPERGLQQFVVSLPPVQFVYESTVHTGS